MADNNIAHAMALVTTRGLWALPGNLCSSRQFYAWCENIGCRFLGGPIANYGLVLMKIKEQICGRKGKGKEEESSRKEREER